ncbi:hypothetical protein, partial [Acidithiobacillus sp.]|uniref:hypothetical protein n=1 Tax=Acidithiobacillus sp. TaxID=1872118 RepID=UPI0031FEC339
MSAHIAPQLVTPENETTPSLLANAGRKIRPQSGMASNSVSAENIRASVFEAAGSEVFAEEHEELDGLLGFRLFYQFPESGDAAFGGRGMGR